MKSVDLVELTGEILTAIDVDCDQNQILLTTRSGKQYLINHMQDCCERVEIVGQDGDFYSLIGKPILLANHEENKSGDRENGTTTTETRLIFRVDDATVVSRWIGTSNGYYSESVDIHEITS